jgi:hypothetical protein
VQLTLSILGFRSPCFLELSICIVLIDGIILFAFRSPYSRNTIILTIHSKPASLPTITGFIHDNTSCSLPCSRALPRTTWNLRDHRAKVLHTPPHLYATTAGSHIAIGIRVIWLAIANATQHRWPTPSNGLSHITRPHTRHEILNSNNNSGPCDNGDRSRGSKC